MTKRKKKQKKKRNIPGAFSLIAFLLFLFFVTPFFVHRWASELPIQLHFCNHIACVIYSLIWLAFAIVGWTYLKKTKNKKTKRKTRKILIILAIVVLLVGIALMNIIYCDADGKMHFMSFDDWFKGLFYFETNYTACCEHNCTVPIPPCIDSDDGRDYKTYGVIGSGANVEDICLENGNLRERYCLTSLIYTSEDINCAVKYGDHWICEEGECRYHEPSMPPPIEYDCTHDSSYPSCLGNCELEPAKIPGDTIEICVAQPLNEDGSDGICVCIPDYVTACGESIAGGGLTCDGYCGFNMFCMHKLNSTKCYCSDSPCYETDNGYDIFTPGACIDVWGHANYDFCNGDMLEEYQCNPAGCTYMATDCAAIPMGDFHCVETLEGSYCAEGLE